MAIRSNIYGESAAQYVGCVLDTFEHNGYHDSDFYAVCWDEELGKVVTVEYDTTRCGGCGRADIDATEEVLAKVYRHYKNYCRDRFDSRDNEILAKKVEKGCTAVVIRGRKIAKGTVGKVFWIGTCYNGYTYRNEDRVGMIIDGKKVFLPLEYVVKDNWQANLLTGKARKEAIRKAAIACIPSHYQHIFA